MLDFYNQISLFCLLIIRINNYYTLGDDKQNKALLPRYTPTTISRHRTLKQNKRVQLHGPMTWEWTYVESYLPRYAIDFYKPDVPGRRTSFRAICANKIWIDAAAAHSSIPLPAPQSGGG